MPPDSAYERVLQTCLKGELKVVNSGLPKRRKLLSTLLGEKYPYVECNDGTPYLFKRKELICLAGMLSTDEQESLLLPIIIEVETNQPQAAAICGGNIEEKVLSKIIGMTLTYRDGKFRLYLPQLALIRKELKTTTQYVFSPSVL